MNHSDDFRDAALGRNKPRKGQLIWHGGKCYERGATYRAVVYGKEVVGVLTWAAKANPKPYLSTGSGIADGVHVPFWSPLQKVEDPWEENYSPQEEMEMRHAGWVV